MKRQLKTASAVLLAVAVLGLFAAAFARRPAAPDKIKKLTFPGYKEFALKNGMELLVVEHHEQPMVSLYFVFKTGSALDPKARSPLPRSRSTSSTRGRRRERRSSLPSG